MSKSKGVEAYKVVIGESRESLVYYFIEENHLCLKEELKKLYSLMKRYGYIKDYPKGAMRVAKKGSAGILCFCTYDSALHFIRTCFISHKNLKIVKVKGFEKVPTKKLVRVGFSNWKEYLKDKKVVSGLRVPSGTIAFKRIRVLE